MQFNKQFEITQIQTLHNTLCDLIKRTIRDKSITYEARRKRKQEKEENTLKSNISKIEDNLNSNPNNENLKHKLLNENR